MNSLDKFRSRVGAKQTELILRKLVDKQEKGEIRTDDDLRKELAKMLSEVTNAGFMTLELPAQPFDKVESERFKSFFDSLNMDLETLFVEVDHTEDVLGGLGQNVVSQLRDLRFALGNLKSEVIARRLRRTPGSGWSTILRDSFDSGYAKLLGRAELDIDLFFDDRTGYSQSHENIPIKADAKIQGVAKKLTLPEIGITKIGFKRVQVTERTPSDIPVENKINPYRIIDGEQDTFWSYVIGTKFPIIGTPEVSVTQIAGPELSGNTLTVDATLLKDSQSHESYVRIVGYSGTLPQYVCLATPEDYSGPGCKWDLGHRCQFNYENQYSQNCANKNCSRYSPTVLTISGLQGPLEDGYRYDTGGVIEIESLSGIHAGQTFRLLVEPSGTPGAEIRLELDLTKPTLINWIEIDPVVTSPFELVSVEFTKQGDTTLMPITTTSAQVLDKIRLDFKAIEANKIFLTLRQETYDKSDLHLQPAQQAIQKIDEFITRDNAPSIEEFYDIELESLLVDYLPNGPMRKAVDKLSVKPQTIKGYFYTFGLFEVNCGLTSYADTAVAVAREVRVITPRMFGLQANLESDVNLTGGMEQGVNGTVEYSVVKFNFDKNNALINVDDFPLPVVNLDGIIVERVFLSVEKTGLLRFSAKSIVGIELVNDQRDLDLDEYISETVTTPLTKTKLTILTPGVTEDSIIIVAYKPAYGVFLNEGRTISIEDNSTQKLSLSEVPAVVLTAAKTANRGIQYSDVNLRIILRRNSLNIYDSPGLRDYQFLISESDEGRFF